MRDFCGWQGTITPNMSCCRYMPEKLSTSTSKIFRAIILSFLRHYKTHYQSILILKNILKTCNYDATNFKSHSFCIHIGTVISSQGKGQKNKLFKWQVVGSQIYFFKLCKQSIRKCSCDVTIFQA